MKLLRLVFITTLLGSLAPLANAQDGGSSAARRDYWWCRADDQKEAIRYLPGKAIAAPTQRHAAVLFDSALLSQHSNSSTQRTECGVSSLLGFHDWVTSNLTKEAKKAGWKLAFVDVEGQSSSVAPASGKSPSARDINGTGAAGVIPGNENQKSIYISDASRNCYVVTTLHNVRQFDDGWSYAFKTGSKMIILSPKDKFDLAVGDRVIIGPPNTSQRPPPCE